MNRNNDYLKYSVLLNSMLLIQQLINSTEDACMQTWDKHFEHCLWCL